MDLVARYFEIVSRYAFEPALELVIKHPFISLIAVFVIVYISMRNYRML